MQVISQLVIYVILHDNKVLLEKRYFLGGQPFNKFIFPAGKVELGEKPQETLMREVREEISITPVKFNLLNRFQEKTLVGEEKEMFVYLVTEFSGELLNRETQKAEYHWIPIDSCVEYLEFDSSKKILTRVKEFLTRQYG